ncbi:MAG: OmpH family outer membrane protein [Saprospiraceae bacterium]|nr:OmpH family outer membrane protein [Saprospiraceae bacterium]
MKNILRVTVFCMLSLAFVASAQAQKFGYINSAALLAEMPKVKQADSNIEAYQKQLEKRYQQDVQALQQMYLEIQKKVNEGTLSPKTTRRRSC